MTQGTLASAQASDPVQSIKDYFARVNGQANTGDAVPGVVDSPADVEGVRAMGRLEVCFQPRRKETAQAPYQPDDRRSRKEQ